MKKSKLQQLKDRFCFKDKQPVINAYGIFNRGLLPNEVEEYVAVRAGTVQITKYMKKLEHLAAGSTCPLVVFEGKEHLLYYRHDIEHYCDVIFNKTPFIMD